MFGEIDVAEHAFGDPCSLQLFECVREQFLVRLPGRSAHYERHAQCIGLRVQEFDAEVVASRAVSGLIQHREERGRFPAVVHESRHGQARILSTTPRNEVPGVVSISHVGSLRAPSGLWDRDGTVSHAARRSAQVSGQTSGSAALGSFAAPLAEKVA